MVYLNYSSEKTQPATELLTPVAEGQNKQQITGRDLVDDVTQSDSQ